MESVTVRVPASTSNCGPGFDTLGMALSLWNEVTVSAAGEPGVMRNTAGLGVHSGENLVALAAAEFFRVTGLKPHGVEYSVKGGVPPARGLGSSVTLLGGIVGALDAIHATHLSREDLAAMVSRIEGHPDNATASVLGGFCVARFCPRTKDLRGVLRREMPEDLVFAVVSPVQEMLTKEARGVLPESIPHKLAVQNVNAVSWLVAAVFASDWGSLRIATEDYLHQPFRLPRITGAKEAIDAGLSAGAFGGWLSGSGSSVLCVVAEEKATDVLLSMEQVFHARNIRCEGQALRADNHGMRVLSPRK